MEFQNARELVSSLALLKSVPTLLVDKPLADQIQVLNVPNIHADDAEQDYEPLHNLVKLAISPYFESIASPGTHDVLDTSDRSASKTD